MKKRNAIILSISLGIIYAVALCCFGVFGASVAAWFMLWIPTFLKIVGIAVGMFLLTYTPIRVQQALALRQKRIDDILTARKLALIEKKQKELDRVAEVSAQVNRYE